MCLFLIFKKNIKKRKMQDFELHGQTMTVKGRGSMLSSSISSANKVEVKKCVLSSKVTFQEILLIRISFVNVLDKWELGNIEGKTATTALNDLQLTSLLH